MEATKRCGTLKSEGPYSHVVGQSAFWGEKSFPRAADVAGVVQGLGPRVAQQGVQVVAETRGPLGAEAIVIPIGVGHQILDSRSPPFRIGQALNHRQGCAENPLILIQQVVPGGGLASRCNPPPAWSICRSCAGRSTRTAACSCPAGVGLAPQVRPIGMVTGSAAVLMKFV